MVCSSCGYRAAQGVGECPRCGQPLVEPSPQKRGKQRTKTATDSVSGVVFIVFGAALLLLFIPALVVTATPAIQGILNLPKPDIDNVSWLTSSRWQAMPVILAGAANLMWSLSGLFMLLAGIITFVRSKGLTQAYAAVVLMVFGLFAQVFQVLIQYQGTAPGLFLQRLWASFGGRQWLYIAQLVILTASLVFISIKKRSQRKQKFNRAAEKAQAMNAARMQAAVQSVGTATPGEASAPMHPGYLPNAPASPQPEPRQNGD